MTKTLRVLTGCILIALAPLAAAQTTTPATTTVDAQATVLDTTAANRGQAQVATQIASNFTNLAGSSDNALALVRALRSGTEVKLASTSFTPPTGKMGWGNVFISLALAQDALTRAGITSPTAEQLKTALMGGDITGADGKTVTLKGILQMRADGMGWGQIAHASGTKLGPVVSAIKSTQVKVAKLPPTTTATTATSTPTSKSASAKGVTTAEGTAGAASSNGKGHDKGITTAAGGSSSGVGKGIVTGAGGAAGAGVTASSGHGKGVGLVTATGGSVNPSATTAAGNSGDNQGKGQGKGKGGG